MERVVSLKTSVGGTWKEGVLSGLGGWIMIRSCSKDARRRLIENWDVGYGLRNIGVKVIAFTRRWRSCEFGTGDFSLSKPARLDSNSNLWAGSSGWVLGVCIAGKYTVSCVGWFTMLFIDLNMVEDGWMEIREGRKES